MLGHRILSLSRKGLECRYLPIILALFAFIIVLPALKEGLMMDDFAYRAIMVKPSQVPERFYDMGLAPENSGTLPAVLFNLYGFSRDRQDIKKGKDYGLLPWWTYDNIKGSLFRPLTAFTHWLDYQLFPDSIRLMHLHNIIWFTVVILLVTLLYQRLMAATWLAGVAAILFLLDENTYFPTMYVAHRHSLLALSFGVLALLAHHRWRTVNSLPAAIVAPILLLFSILSHEVGIVTFAYLFAYAVVLEQTNRVRRALSLVPAVVVIVLWRIFYNTLGYGVYGCGLYVDPGYNPLNYALAVVKIAPILLMGQLGWQSPEILLFTPDSAITIVWLISVAFLVLVFIVLVPLLRKSRLARFWFTATIFSVLPLCAAWPSSRHLPFVGIAAFGLISLFVGGLLAKESWIPKSLLRRVATWAICIIFILVHVPMAAVARIMAPKMTSFAFNVMNLGMDVGSPTGLENQDMVVVNAPSAFSLLVVPLVKAYEGEPLPKAVRILAPGLRALEIHRSGEKTLLLRTKSGSIFSCNQQSLLHFVYFFKRLNDAFRSDRFPFHAGQTIILPRFEVQVIAVDQKGQPKEVSFNFSVPLEDASLYWLQFDWQNSCYSSFEVPAIGETVKIAGPPRVPLSKSMKYMMNTLFGR